MAGVRGMKTGGHNKLPSELKQIRGTEKPSRVNVNEPKVTAGFPAPPKRFTRREVECYESLCNDLREMNITTWSDGKALAEMALVLEQLENLTEGLNDEDHRYLIDTSTVTVRETRRIKTTTRKASYMLNPMLKARHEAWGIYWKMLRDFGMTPQSRSGVKTISTEGDGGNEFFN